MTVEFVRKVPGAGPSTGPHRLTNLRVQKLSLVRRAAVRDSDDPTKPMTFLLTKSEDQERPGSLTHALALAEAREEAARQADERRRQLLTKAEREEAIEARRMMRAAAMVDIDSAVADLRKWERDLTPEQAMAKVLKANPSLYADYRERIAEVRQAAYLTGAADDEVIDFQKADALQSARDAALQRVLEAARKIQIAGRPKPSVARLSQRPTPVGPPMSLGEAITEALKQPSVARDYAIYLGRA